MIEQEKYSDLALKTFQKTRPSNYIKNICSLRNNLDKRRILII